MCNVTPQSSPSNNLFIGYQITSASVFVCSAVALAIIFAVPQATGLWYLAPATLWTLDVLLLCAVVSCRLVIKHQKKRASIPSNDQAPPRDNTPADTTLSRSTPSDNSAPKGKASSKNTTHKRKRRGKPKNTKKNPTFPPVRVDFDARKKRRAALRRARGGDTPSSGASSTAPPPVLPVVRNAPPSLGPSPLRSRSANLSIPSTAPKVVRLAVKIPPLIKAWRRPTRTHPARPFGVPATGFVVPATTVEVPLLLEEGEEIDEKLEDMPPLQREEEVDSSGDETGMLPLRRSSSSSSYSREEEELEESIAPKKLPLYKRVETLYIDSDELEIAIQKETKLRTLRSNTLKDNAKAKAKKWKSKLEMFSQRENNAISDAALREISCDTKWTPQLLIDKIADPIATKLITLFQEFYLAIQRVANPKQNGNAIRKKNASTLNDIGHHLDGIWALLQKDLLRTAHLQEAFLKTSPAAFFKKKAKWFERISKGRSVQQFFNNLLQNLEQLKNQPKALRNLEQIYRHCLGTSFSKNSLLKTLLELLLGNIHLEQLDEIQKVLSPRYLYLLRLKNTPLKKLSKNEINFLKKYAHNRVMTPQGSLKEIHPFDLTIMFEHAGRDIYGALLELNPPWEEYEGAPTLANSSRETIHKMVTLAFKTEKPFPATLEQFYKALKLVALPESITNEMENYYAFIRRLVSEVFKAFTSHKATHLSEPAAKLGFLVLLKCLMQEKNQIFEVLHNPSHLNKVRPFLTVEDLPSDDEIQEELSCELRQTTLAQKIQLVLKELLERQISTALHDPMLFEMRKMGRGFDSSVSLKEFAFDPMRHAFRIQPWLQLISTILNPKTSKKESIAPLYNLHNVIEGRIHEEQSALKEQGVTQFQEVIDKLTLSPETTSETLREGLHFACVTLQLRYETFPPPLKKRAEDILYSEEIDPFALRRDLYALFVDISVSATHKAVSKTLVIGLEKKASEKRGENVSIITNDALDEEEELSSEDEEEENPIDTKEKDLTNWLRKEFTTEVQQLEKRGLTIRACKRRDDHYSLDTEVKALEELINMNEYSQFKLSMGYDSKAGLDFHPVHHRRVRLLSISKEEEAFFYRVNDEIKKPAYHETVETLLREAQKIKGFKTKRRIFVIPNSIANRCSQLITWTYSPLNNNLQEALDTEEEFIFAIVKPDHHDHQLFLLKSLKNNKEVLELEKSLAQAKKATCLFPLVTHQMISPALLAKSYQGGKLATILGGAISTFSWLGNGIQKKALNIIINYFFSSGKESLSTISFLPPKEMQALKTHLLALFTLFLDPLADLLLSDKPTPAKQVAAALGEEVVIPFLTNEIPAFLAEKESCTRQELIDEGLKTLDTAISALKNI